MIRSWIPITIAIATLLLLVGCGGDSEAANSNYVAIEPVEAAAATANAGAPTNSATTAASSESTTSATTVPAANTDVVHTTPTRMNNVSPEVFDEATNVYATFLAERATVISGVADPSVLDDVATPTANQQVADLRSTNDALRDVESVATITDLMEWPNVEAIEEQGDTLVFTDCTERQSVNWIGTTVIVFVTNDVVMVRHGDSFKVDSVIETQNGSFTESPEAFGCVPTSFAVRAESLATVVVDEVATAIAKPAATLDRGLSSAFAGEARAQLESSLSFLMDENVTQDLSPLLHIEVVGMDVNKPDFTVIVSVCRYYPDGQSIIDADTGELHVVAHAPGASHEEWYYLKLDPVAGASATPDAVTSVRPQGADCWDY